MGYDNEMNIMGTTTAKNYGYDDEELWVQRRGRNEYYGYDDEMNIMGMTTARKYGYDDDKLWVLVRRRRNESYGYDDGEKLWVRRRRIMEIGRAHV